MRRAEPNAGHRALARLAPELLITQNVDGLHERVGTPRLVALHGRIADVVCLGCRATSAARSAAGAARRAQPRLRRAARRGRGPPRRRRRARRHRRLRGARTAPACGGVLKPDVVFFGENVPAPRVERCYAAVDALAESRRRAAGGRLEPDGDVRAAGSCAGPRKAGHAGGDRQPGRDPRRRRWRRTRVDAGCSEFLSALVR